MPHLERLIGLERAGAWSITFELICLAPTVLTFFYGTGAYGTKGAIWNEVLLFGGIAASRIGLWSFDLCQVSLLSLLHRGVLLISLVEGITTSSCRSPTSKSPYSTPNIPSKYV
jgi:hypothetical protein